MAKKKKSELQKNDFAAEEDLEIYGFTSEPIVAGECISSFSFNDDSINENDINLASNNETNRNINNSPKTTSNMMNFDVSSNDKQNLSTNQSVSNKNNILEDNRKAPIVNGMAPPIDGEYLNVKRTYMLRSSTVRKINELKSIHPNLNTYVSTIVDLAIADYYKHMVNDGGNQ